MSTDMGSSFVSAEFVILVLYMRSNFRTDVRDFLHSSIRTIILGSVCFESRYLQAAAIV